MEMKTPLVAISAFVVVVVLAAVLMPVLDDASTTEVKFTNEGYYPLSMKKLDSDETLTVAWDHTKPTIFTVNGEDLEVPSNVPSSVTIIGSDNFVVRLFKASSTYYVQLYGNDGNGNNVQSSGDTSSGVDIDFTVSGTTMTIHNTYGGGVTKTVPVDADVFYISDEGPYVMKNTGDAAYVLGDSEIYGIGRSAAGGTELGIYITGTVDDGMTVSYFFNTATTSNLNVASSEVAGYNDLYQLDKITFTTTVGSTDYDQTYSYFIVPAEVTAEKAIHLDSNEIALLAAIPALVIIALLIGVLAIFARSKMD